MLIALIVVSAIVAPSLLFVLALGRASRRLKASDDDAERLALLGTMRSPSGKAFFPTKTAAIELAEALDDHALVHSQREQRL